MRVSIYMCLSRCACKCVCVKYIYMLKETEKLKCVLKLPHEHNKQTSMC